MNDFSGSDVARMIAPGMSVDKSAQRAAEPNGIVRQLPESVQIAIRERQEQYRQIVRDAEAVRSNRDERQSRLEGKVVKHSEDGKSYTVRTPDGDIVIQAPRAQDRPPLESRIIVQLPPDVDQPDLPVRVSLAPRSAPDTRIIQTPVDVQISPQPASLPAPALLAESIPVRIAPLTSAPDLAGFAPTVVIDTLVSAPPLAAVITPAVLAQVPLDSANAPLASISMKAAPKAPVTLPQMITLTGENTGPSALPAHITRHLVRPEIITQGAPMATVLPASQGVQAGAALQTSYAQPVFENLPAGVLPDPAALTIPQHGFITKVTAEMADHTLPLLLSSAKAGEAPMVYMGKSGERAIAASTAALYTTISPAWFEGGAARVSLTGSAQFFVLHGQLNALAPGTLITVMPAMSVPQGSESLRVLPQNIPADIAALPIVGPYLLKAESWPAMNDVHQALTKHAPAAAQAMSAITPSLSGNPAQMMPAVLFFVAAVRGGDLAQWLGDKTIDILRKADGKALNKLLSEGELMGRVASERSSGDWRSLPVPFYHNDEFQKILLHVKDEAYEQTEDSKGHKNVRFLFELTLDKIGDLQLDGFFHSGGRLDLIVRTHERFSQAMQQEMRRLYAGAVEQAGVHGELAFQTSLKQWVMIDYKEKGAAV